MNQIATITHIFTKDYVEVALSDGPGQMRAVAEAHEKVMRGDAVALEPAMPRQEPGTWIIYALPVISFILGYFLGRAAQLDVANRLAAGCVLGVLAFVLAWIANRRTRLRRVMKYRVIRVLQKAEYP